MQKIIIKATYSDESGDAQVFQRFNSPVFAEMAFYAFTHDSMYADLNWFLIVDGETINWHRPNRGVNV